MSAAPELASDPTRTDGNDAPVLEPTYTAGLSDALGDRLICFTTPGAMSLELLRFKPELGDAPGFEDALRTSVETIGLLSHPSLVTVRTVERSDEIDGLALVSVRESGRRLSDLIPRARGVAYALELIRQIGPALALLHEHGQAHGALTPDRIIVTREGHPIVLEHVLGAALESLSLSTEELRSTAGIAVPERNLPPKINARLDVLQLGFVALSLLVGRRLPPSAYPGGITSALDEFSASDRDAAAEFRPWLERALQLGHRPFADASEALAAFQNLPEALLSRAVEPPPQPPESTAVHSAATAERPATPASLTSVVAPAATPEEPLEAPHQLFGSSARLESIRTMGYFRWAALAVGIVVLGQAAIIGYLYLTGVSTEAPVIQVASPPGREAPPPAPVPDLNPTVNEPVQQAGSPAAVSPPASPVGAEPAPDAPPPVARVGGVTVTAPIDLHVFKDGELLGTTAGPIALDAGRHALEVVNEALGFRSQQTVTVRGGQMASVSIAIPEGRININAVPWAEVWIDGASAGQTPLANLSLPIGEHEILFRHPDLGEQRQTVVVKVDGITRVSAVFQR